MIADALKVYVTVVEQSHFSKAGAMLNLSQPGVSLHIRNLENELGTRLLHRSPKQVRMTEAGTILYKYAKQILSLYDDAGREIRLLRDEVTGNLQIGASFTIGEYILPARLAEFARQYPLVSLQVTIGNTEEIIAAVRANQLDVGFIEGETADPELTIIPYMKDEMIVIAPAGHPLADSLAVEKDMLQDQTWVLREHGSGTRAYSDHFFQESGVHVKRAYVFNSSQGVKEAVAAGLGLGMLSRWIVRKELAGGEISELRLRQRLLEREFLIIRHTDNPEGMAVQMFIEKVLAAPGK